MSEDLGLVVITDRTLTGGRPLSTVLDAAIDGGARTVLLRDKDLTPDERSEIATPVRERLQPLGGTLIIASDAALTLRVGAHGLHLAAGDPYPAADQRPALVGRSCHDLSAVTAAADEGCDYAFLSPIFATPSKPDYGPALGLGALSAAAASVEIPVIALGGLRSGRAALAMRNGAGGIAVMSHIMRAPDPARAVHGLLHELGRCHCNLIGGPTCVREPRP